VTVTRPFVVAAGEGQELRGPAGGPALIKARAETTNGTVTVIENVVGLGQGPPKHLHVREDELFHVLEGRIRVEAGDEVLDAGPGALVFIPRGVPHVFQAVGDVDARLLVVFTPAGMERFFEGVAALPDGPPDPAAVRELAHGAWMEVLGPPLPPPGAE
jgi:quercetin dioxygenase-like cupin family protein